MQNRCGYCHERGHNRRTCPSYQESLQKSAAAGSSWAAEELEKRGNGAKKASRKCSFCTDYGHDRRTCEKVKTFIEYDSSMTLEARELYKKNAGTLGFGPGTLVQVVSRNYSFEQNAYVSKTLVGVVSQILWDAIDHRTSELRAGSRSADLVCITFYDSNSNNEKKVRTCYAALPPEVFGSGEDRDQETRLSLNSIKILNPVDSPSVPKDFLSVKALKKASKAETKGATAWDWRIREVLDKAA